MTTGYSVNVSDYKTSFVYIIDCDHLTQSQALQVFSTEWQAKTKIHFDLDFIEVRQSASKSPDKAKIFCFKHFERSFSVDETNTPQNIDLTYHQFRLDFQEYTGIETDKAMDAYSQITFGCKIQDTELPAHDVTHLNCSQPKHLKDTSYNHTIAQDVIIPINIAEYTQLFGKNIMALPRLDWNTKVFNKKSSKSKKIIIKQGNRYNTSFRLINTIVFNLFVCKYFFNKNFTLKDCDNKLKQVIYDSFENPNTFLKESGDSLFKSTYSLYKTLETQLQHKDIISIYKTICKKLNLKERYIYKPNSCSYSAFFNSLIPVLNQISDRKNRMKYLFEVSNFETDLFNKLKKVYNRKKHLLKACQNTGNFKPSKYQYILTEYENTNESVTIKSHLEQIFCIKNKIPYTWIKKTINFLFKPFNYISLSLIQLKEWVCIRNKLKLNLCSFEDLRNFNREFLLFNC